MTVSGGCANNLTACQDKSQYHLKQTDASQTTYRVVDTILILSKWKKYRHTHTYTNTHVVNKTGLKMLESTDDNFKIISTELVLKVLKDIWTE